jgi:YbbR domain-containing protein
MDNKTKAQPQKKDKKRISKFSSFIKTERAILMICIGIAFLFWLFTKLSYHSRTTLNIKIDYILPKNKILSKPGPEQLEINVEGTGWELLSVYFNRKKYKVDFDLSDNKEQNISTMSISGKISKQLPGSIKILEIKPEYIQLVSEDRISKKVPVRLISNIELSNQFLLKDSIQISPDSVIVSGPTSVIENISFWETKNFELKNVESDFDKTVQLKSPKNNSVQIDPVFIKAIGKITQTTEKKFEVDIKKIGVPEGLLLVLLPKKTTVSCIVSMENFDDLNPGDFKVIADFSKIKLNEGKTIRLELEDYPGFVEKVSLQPKNVEYIIKSNK